MLNLINSSVSSYCHIYSAHRHLYCSEIDQGGIRCSICSFQVILTNHNANFGNCKLDDLTGYEPGSEVMILFVSGSAAASSEAGYLEKQVRGGLDPLLKQNAQRPVLLLQVKHSCAQLQTLLSQVLLRKQRRIKEIKVRSRLCPKSKIDHLSNLRLTEIKMTLFPQKVKKKEQTFCVRSACTTWLATLKRKKKGLNLSWPLQASVCTSFLPLRWVIISLKQTQYHNILEVFLLVSRLCITYTLIQRVSSATLGS